MANGKATYPSQPLYKVDVQVCRGGVRERPSLWEAEGTITASSKNLRRRTDLSMDRETDAENGSALARMCPYTARPGGEPTEAPREAVP